MTKSFNKFQEAKERENSNIKEKLKVLLVKAGKEPIYQRENIYASTITNCTKSNFTKPYHFQSTCFIVFHHEI